MRGLPLAGFELTQAIKLEPANAALAHSRGAVHAQNDDLASAISDSTKAIALEPKYANAYLNRGLAHWEKGSSSRGRSRSGQSG